MDTPNQPDTGSSRRNPGFSLSIRPDRQPYCPKCGVPLQPQVTRIRAGLAACARCTQSHRLDYGFLVDVYETGLLDGSWTQTAGVRFWVPDRLPPYSIYDALHDLNPPVQPASIDDYPTPHASSNGNEAPDLDADCTAGGRVYSHDVPQAVRVG